ncbi:MAG: AsmA family protein, partial [Alphaproteobacteria bacterium]
MATRRRGVALSGLLRVDPSNTGRCCLLNPLKKLTLWARQGPRTLAPAAAWWRSRRDWLAEHDPVYRSWSRPGRVEKLAATTACGLIAALLLALALFDWNLLRGPIGRWASSHYDREIVIDGDLDVRLFSLTPSLSVHGLRVGGPPWARGANTLEVGRIEGAVRLRRLLVGQIELPRLAVTRPVAVLIVDQQGRRSWALDPDEADDGPATLPLIERLSITNGQVLYRDISRDISLDARVTASETARGVEGQTGFHLDGSGSRNGQPLTVTVQGGAFVNIRRDRPYDFSAALEGAGSSLVARGRILRPFDFARFDAALTITGQNLADQYPLTGIATPSTPPYRLTGDLSRNGNRWTLKGIDGRVGASDLAGDLEVDRIKDRLTVTADLASRSLDIDDLSVVLGAQVQSSSEGDTVV